jgi:hypothetical protein
MYIAHRINYLDARIAAEVFAAADGIEFDIRDSAGQIIVTHDPFSSGQLFADFLSFCVPNKFYIVNVKSEGIESVAISALEAAGIRQFFLLDCSIPAMVRLGRAGETRMAVRFSEYESLETVLSMAPFVQWVWVDVFARLPLDAASASTIHNAGLKICLVSPELQAQQEKLFEYKCALLASGVGIDAVCTKLHNISSWLFERSPCPTM